MAQDKKSFESSLHDVVYSIDTGTGLKIIRVTLYALLVLMIMMFYTATQFRGLMSEESMDYSQLGRNISLNGGLITKCVRPVSMWKVGEHTPGENPRIGNHPDLFHPPAYPAVLSIGFKFFEMIGLEPFVIPAGSRSATLPAEQWVVLPVNHLFTILTGVIVFSLGKRLFSREIGLIGMTIFFLSNLVWKDSVSGLNISMASFFVLASFYAMVVAMLNRRDKPSSKAWIFPFFFSILFSAIAFLTRYIAFAAIPGIALFAWLMSGRFRGGTRYAVVFIGLWLVMVSPWLYRNVKICGNPMGMAGLSALTDTAKYPGSAFERQLHPEFTAKQTIDQLKKKWVANYSGKSAATIPGLGGGVLMSFFIVSFFFRFVRPPVNHLRWGVGLSLLLMVVVAGFFSESSINMIHVFWPFAILYGLAFFYILLDRLDLGAQLYVTGLKVFVGILSVIPMVLAIMPPQDSNPYPPYYAPIISQVSNMLNEREVMCTDMPWATAWYGDRVSIQLPKDIDDFYEINDYMQYISGIYITTITKDKPFVKQLLDGPEKSWLPVISGRTPSDFPLKQAVSLNRQDQIFLSDRNRWSSKEANAPQQ